MMISKTMEYNFEKKISSLQKKNKKPTFCSREIIFRRINGEKK